MSVRWTLQRRSVVVWALLTVALFSLSTWAGGNGRAFEELQINKRLVRSAVEPVVCRDKAILELANLTYEKCTSSLDSSFDVCWTDIQTLIPQLDALDPNTGRPLVKLSDSAFDSLLELSLRCLQSRTILQSHLDEGAVAPSTVDGKSRRTKSSQSTLETEHTDVSSLLTEIGLYSARNSENIESLIAAFQKSQFSYVGSVDSESVLIREEEDENSAERIVYAGSTVFPKLMAEAEIELITYFEGSVILYSQRIFRTDSMVFKVRYALDDLANLPICDVAQFRSSEGICEYVSSNRWHTLIRWVSEVR